MALSCWSHQCLMRVGKDAPDVPRLVHGWSRVSRRRTAIGAIQTVVVAVLTVVVFLTLLQPEGGEMPSGLEAPAQQGAADSGADVRSDYVRNRSGQAGDGTGEVERRGTSNARPPASTGTLGSGPPLPGAALPDEAYPGDGDSPTADQYGNTLARLSDDLR